MKVLAVVFSLAIGILGFANFAHAQARAVQVTNDSNAQAYSVLVIKQLGQQQWVVVANFDNEEVTGNVFNLDGSNPQFLRCDIGEPFPSLQEDVVGVDVQISCWAAAACTAMPCGEDGAWTFVGERAIPGSFFLP